MRTLALTSLALLVTTPAFAQQWTAEEQEVIDTITMCWDAWVEALADETPDHFYETCRSDEDALYWWTTDGAPEGQRAVRRHWARWREMDNDWVDMRPVAIRIFGDVAIVYLYGYWRVKASDGPVITQYKRTEVSQRRDAGWTFIGAQGTPESPADADPYD